MLKKQQKRSITIKMIKITAMTTPTTAPLLRPDDVPDFDGGAGVVSIMTHMESIKGSVFFVCLNLFFFQNCWSSKTAISFYLFLLLVV